MDCYQLKIIMIKRYIEEICMFLAVQQDAICDWWDWPKEGLIQIEFIWSFMNCPMIWIRSRDNIQSPPPQPPASFNPSVIGRPLSHRSSDIYQSHNSSFRLNLIFDCCTLENPPIRHTASTNRTISSFMNNLIGFLRISTSIKHQCLKKK